MLAVGYILRFSIQELIRTKKQKIAVNNAVTDILWYVILSLSKII